jgi:hypothetical protein
MYRVEPAHKFSADLTRPDYIQPIDYVRPMVGMCVFGFIYNTMVISICAMVHPLHAQVMLLGSASSIIYSTALYTMMGFLITISHHTAWLSRLKTHGSEAYRRRLSLQMPANQALELCLAAATRLEANRVVGLDEERGELRVMSKRPWWSAYESAQIDIELRESMDGVTHLNMSAQKSLTRFRLKLLQLMLGEKWVPLVLASGNWWRHSKMMDEMAEYISAHPNWNYHHIAGQVHEPPEYKAIS